MVVNRKTLEQVFDGSLGPIAVQEARGAAKRIGRELISDALGEVFGRSSSSQIDKFLADINQSGVARTNKFEVKLNPPASMNQLVAQSLVLRCESVGMPGLNLSTSPDSNIYGPTRDVVEGVTYADEITMSFILDRGFNIRKFFTEWMELAYDTESWNLKYYEEYASGTADIYQLDDNHSPAYGVKLWECYPKNFGPIEYSSGSSNEIARMSVNFNFRHWTDISKHGDKQPTETALPNLVKSIAGAVVGAATNKIISKLKL